MHRERDWDGKERKERKREGWKEERGLQVKESRAFEV